MNFICFMSVHLLTYLFVFYCCTWWHTTTTHPFRRTSLDKGSARCKGLCLYNTQDSQKNNSLYRTVSASAIPRSEWPQAYALDRTTIDYICFHALRLPLLSFPLLCYWPAYGGFKPTFRDYLSVSSSSGKLSKKLLGRKNTKIHGPVEG